MPPVLFIVLAISPVLPHIEITLFDAADPAIPPVQYEYPGLPLFVISALLKQFFISVVPFAVATIPPRQSPAAKTGAVFLHPDITVPVPAYAAIPAAYFAELTVTAFVQSVIVTVLP